MKNDAAEYNVALGRTVRLARKAAQRSQSDLAAALGVSQVQVSRLEAGRNPWTVDALRIVAGVCGLKVEDILAAVHAPNVSGLNVAA